MNTLARTKEIPLLSLPVTSLNRHNARKHPAIDLHNCTPFQTLSYTGLRTGSICLIGEPSEETDIIKALCRRSRKPFLLLDKAGQANALLPALNPAWVEAVPQCSLPAGNGALLLERPDALYVDLCQYLNAWADEYYLILHLGKGLQIGPEILNQLNAVQECLILSNAIPQSIRKSEVGSLSCREFLENMHGIYFSSFGGSAKEIVDLLPTYCYERVSNTTSYNNFRTKTDDFPAHIHFGNGVSISQSRTLDFKKSIYEQEELRLLFMAGLTVIFNVQTNTVYVTRIV